MTYVCKTSALLSKASLAAFDFVNDALLVFAPDIEAAGEFDEVSKVFCGAGKIAAAFSLTKAITQRNLN